MFLPGKWHGQRSLEGYSPWGCKESDMTEHMSTHTHSVRKGIVPPNNSLHGVKIYGIRKLYQTYTHFGNSLVAQWQRTHLPRQETRVQSLSQEDPLEKETATHSNILA